jgi:hypothetical protein
MHWNLESHLTGDLPIIRSRCDIGMAGGLSDDSATQQRIQHEGCRGEIEALRHTQGDGLALDKTKRHVDATSLVHCHSKMILVDGTGVW